jgi:hypothetical protein
MSSPRSFSTSNPPRAHHHAQLRVSGASPRCRGHTLRSLNHPGDAYQTNATTVLVNIGASHAQSRPYADGPLCVDVVVIGVGAG